MFKEMLRQATPLSPEQAGLSLCQAVHGSHFQLLVLLGSYVKLMDMLLPVLQQQNNVSEATLDQYTG